TRGATWPREAEEAVDRAGGGVIARPREHGREATDHARAMLGRVDVELDSHDPRRVRALTDPRCPIDEEENERRHQGIEAGVSGEGRIKSRIVEESGIEGRAHGEQFRSKDRIRIDATRVGARAEHSGECQRYPQLYHCVIMAR